MHRFSTRWLVLGAWVAFSCGAPAELDESLFPDTYTGDETANTPTAGAPAAGGSTATPVAGSGGTPSVGTAGTAGAPVGTSGAGPVGGGAGGTPAAGGAGSAGGCPSDITVLFNRPSAEGGCAGSGCHIPGGTTPDLVSPDPASRLLNVASSCNGLPYIGATADQSLLPLKITTPPGGCGYEMPFLAPDALSAEDEACITAWVASIGAGG